MQVFERIYLVMWISCSQWLMIYRIVFLLLND